MRKETPVPTWNPYQTFTWSKWELEAWYKAYGEWTFYDGLPWKPESKRLSNTSLLTVKFIKYEA